MVHPCINHKHNLKEVCHGSIYCIRSYSGISHSGTRRSDYLGKGSFKQRGIIIHIDVDILEKVVIILTFSAEVLVGLMIWKRALLHKEEKQ